MKKQTLFFILATGIFLSSCKIFSTLYPLSENDNDFIFKKHPLKTFAESNPLLSKFMFIIIGRVEDK